MNENAGTNQDSSDKVTPSDLESNVFSVVDQVTGKTVVVSVNELLEITSLPFYQNGAMLVFGQMICAADAIACAAADKSLDAISAQSFINLRSSVLLSIAKLYARSEWAEEISMSPVIQNIQGVSIEQITEFFKEFAAGPADPVEIFDKFKGRSGDV